MPAVRTPEEIRYMADKPYLSILATLGYVSRGSRPDLAPAVAVHSQYAARPLHIHWDSLHHLCKYVASTRDMGMTMTAGDIELPESASTKSRKYAFDGRPVEEDLQAFPPPPAARALASTDDDPFPFDADDATSMETPMQLLSFADASHGNEETGRRAIQGTVIAVGGCIVHWASKIQKLVALSTMEAETVATSPAGQHTIYRSNMLQELGVPFYSPTVVANGNASSVSVAHNHEHHQRARHIDIKHSWIRENIFSGRFAVVWVAGKDMLADVLTKPLPRIAFQYAVRRLGLRSFVRGRVVDA
ncbi:hypothetical protein P7C70_g4901, partial [Phenoliferia sp. Uapishka_3]